MATIMLLNFKKKTLQTKLELAIVSIVWRWTCATVKVEHDVK